MGLISTSEITKLLGATSDASARSFLRRAGIEPVSRLPGRGGESQYDEDRVKAAIAARPGKGRWRRDASTN